MLKDSPAGKYVLNSLREDGQVFLPQDAPLGQKLVVMAWLEYGEVKCEQTEKFGKKAVLLYDPTHNKRLHHDSSPLLTFY